MKEVSGEIKADYRTTISPVPTHQKIQRKQCPFQLFGDKESQLNAIIADVRERSVLKGQPVLIGVRSVESSEWLSKHFNKVDIPHRVLNARQDADEAKAIAEAGQKGSVVIATNMAGRGTDIKPSAEALAAGGLHVILTELHESTRIDRQLYGRAGRQGQVGSAQAITSLEDPLLTAYLPRLSTWVGKNWGRAHAPMPAVVAWSLKALAQLLSERHRAAIRRETRRQDDKLVKTLGLAGRGE